MKRVDLKNKVVFASFFMTLTFISAYGLLYHLLKLEKNIDLAIGIGFGLLLIMNIFFIQFIDDLIIKEIRKIMKKVEKVANGNLKEKFTTNRQDEIGGIYRAMDKIIRGEVYLIEEVGKSSIKFNEATKNLRLLIIENKEIIGSLSNNIDIVQVGTDNQINGIEQVEYSIDEMVVGINRINDTVTIVASNANKSVAEAKKGNTALEKVVMQMNQIQQNAEESMMTIRELGDQIKEIQKIVDVIRSISSRTNLLALNATIEAERAAENGEGFVVVAEEIKNLAVQSTSSTVKIEKIARNIMDKKDRAIEQIDKNGKEVRSGIIVLNEASQAFNKILYSTGDIGSQLNEVSSSSEQLSNSTHNIVENIDKTSEASKEFSKSLENVETFVEQQENSIDKLILSIEDLNAMTKEIESFLSKYQR